MTQIALFIVLLGVGYLFGQRSEKKHYRSIQARENELIDMPVIATRYPPKDGVYQQQLVTGSVVVASDYFKTFLAGLINIFGGSVISYESLLDRGRREALLRMKHEAERQGASMVFNVKFETASVGSGRTSSIEVLAYGTALTVSDTRALPDVD